MALSRGRRLVLARERKRAEVAMTEAQVRQKQEAELRLSVAAESLYRESCVPKKYHKKQDMWKKDSERIERECLNAGIVVATIVRAGGSGASADIRRDMEALRG